MTLLDRIQQAQSCAVVACQRHRTTDSLFCREHLTEMWANRLDRQADGTYTARRVFTARDMTRSAA